MYPQIKNLFVILFILCFWVGCTQVKQVVTDVKEGIKESFKGEKEDTQKAPAEAKETKPQKEPESTDTGTTKEVSSPPAKAKTKETKAAPAPSKKGTQKTTQPSTGDAFGPK